jgi:cyclic di-GMP phosphodiesterase
MPQPLRILLVEDAPDDALLLVRLLRNAGYDLTQARVETEAEFRAELERAEWDVILCDYSLPQFGAAPVLRIVQEMQRDIPVILVTGTISEEQAVKLADLGAHDYIIKGRYERLVPAIARETREAQSRARERRSASDLRLALAALKTTNDALLERNEESLHAFVHALALRDNETAGHTERVTLMAERLGRLIGEDNGMLERIRLGAWLHDIGKMGIPDAILHKPGPLNAAEWIIMRKHPIYAYELLYPFVHLRPAIDTAYCHHEQWDGSGYPRGLKGKKIPLPARIFAFPDAWDAMRSKRPYKKAMTKKQTLARIRAAVGTHFDPEIAAVFLPAIEDGRL